jgi:hypothetical protein
MILLNDLMKIEDPTKYKLHLACVDKHGEHPLDVYVADKSEWIGWNQWRGDRDDWTRDYIFSLIEFYPKYDSWLFGGVFKVIERKKDCYKVENISSFDKYEGRLIVLFHRKMGMRGRAFYLETYLDQFKVAEILRSPYCGEYFPGYENIDRDFNILEPIFKNENIDWKTALSQIKGVYLICDKSNGKKYVGSAYGGDGIWSRWSCYIGTGHGWNDELITLINEKGKNYARMNFKFSLLEIMKMTASDELIRNRESFWKRTLLSREFGYNKN